MDLYRAIRPLLFTLPPETAHDLTHTALRTVQDTPVERLLERRYSLRDPRLETRAFGCSFPNPVGIAAGFDKNAEIPRALAALGFGHVEIGGVTADPQAGNSKPRLFRLAEDEALINRMGFNNDGADVIAERLADAPPCPVPLGANIGKSKATPIDDARADYRYTLDRIRDHVDYVVVNVSSPNTPGLRELQDAEPLEAILDTLLESGGPPVLVKLSPDLHRETVEDAVALANRLELAGIVATNTTTERPESLHGGAATETGGLSGKPLAERATEQIRFVAERTDLPVVGVGGVFTAADAYEKLRAGASVVQLYTSLIYRGPAIARRINQGLLTLMERDGFDDVGAVVGADL